MSEHEQIGTQDVTTRQFLRGLRVGVLVIALAVLGSLSVVLHHSRYHSLWLQLVAYSTLVGIVVSEIVLVVRNRPWNSARWAALTAVVAAYLVSCVSLGPGLATRSPDWAFGAVGWVALILLLDLPLRYLVSFLLLHEAITVANLLLDHGGEAELLNLAVGSLGTIGFPLGTGIGASALQRVARMAATSAAEEARLHNERTLAAQSAKRRRKALADLDRTLIPLLEGIADGSLDVNDTSVQRRCRVEAARSRRYFGGVDEGTHELMNAIQQCIRVAEENDVPVDLQWLGDCDDPPPKIRESLTDALPIVLATAKAGANVVVMDNEGILSVSVTADCGLIEIPDASVSEVQISSFFEEEGNLLWVESQWMRPVL